jgi:hypothetical protein
MPDEIVPDHLHVPVEAELDVAIGRVEGVAAGCVGWNFSTFSGLIWLNCRVMMSTAAASVPSNSRWLMATPIIIPVGIRSLSASSWCAVAGRTARPAATMIVLCMVEGLMVRSIV